MAQNSIFSMGQGFIKGQIIDVFASGIRVGETTSLSQWMKPFTIYDEVANWKYKFRNSDYLEVEEKKYCKVFKILVKNKNDKGSRTDATLYCDSFEMDKQEFFDTLKNEFNAVAKDHDSMIFHTREDADKAKEWMESIMVANKLKKSK